jgi:DNA repair exonuclease SbcCD ATPase subunit
LDMQKAELDNPGDIISNETERESLFAAKARKDNAIKTLKKIVDLGNTCHVCNQEIDEEFKHNTAEVEIKIRDEAKVEIERLEQEVNDIGRHNMKVKKFEKLQQDWSNTFRSIDRSLPTRIQSEEELKSKAEHLSEVLKEKRKEIKLIADQNTEITKRNTRIQVIQEQTQEFITQLGEATKTLNQHAELDSNLEVLKKAFSTNGLLAYKIENLVVELEEVANTYLAELSDGRFTLGFNVQKDKLNVEITDNGNIVDILALSSGELARVNTATLIAIRKLMSSISKSKINILFLDEVINVLDDVGREKMVELLIKEDELNTYVVSHGWTHPLLDKIEVVKDGNVSKLEW